MKMLLPGERAGLRKGRQEGRQVGRQEGRQEEAANLVLRLARKRFAIMSAETEKAICLLPLERLESLSEALLDFVALEELERWLRDHAQD